ncbi:hypothetical protein ACVWYF_002165 [Hymenobacter sp. UYAg731]
MKKTLLLLLLAVTSASSAFAQAAPGGALSSKDYTGGKTTNSRNTGFGVKAGYNLNSLRGDAVNDAAKKAISRNAHSDFHAGVYGQFGLNEFSSIQAELLYSRQGFSGDNGVTTATYNMDYIALPILYVGNFTDNLSFHVGPQASLLINARRDGNSLGLSENGFHTLDYGAAAGLEARVGPARLGARYNLSLGKIFQDPTSSNPVFNTDPNKRNIYNSLVQLYVGIGFTQ